MAYVVYIQNTETGKIEETSVFEEPPLIISEDGSTFYSVKFLSPSFFPRGVQ